MRIKTKSKSVAFLTAGALSQEARTVEFSLWYLTQIRLVMALVEGLTS